MAVLTGGVSVAAELLDGAGEPVVQPSLFPSAQLGEIDPAGSRAMALRERTARSGRPLGSRNRRTEAFRDYVLARSAGEHPVDGLIEAYRRPVHDLAAELGCTPVEALNVQLAARRTVLEYCEGKMPVTVALTGAGIVPLIIDLGGGADQKGEEFQMVAGPAGAELERGELEGGV